jgi:uncharacterized protein (TIGR03118 family)
MKKMFKARSASFALLGLSIGLIFVAVSGCKKTRYDSPGQQADEVAKRGHDQQELRGFSQVNLVANNDEYSAARIDPTLVNAWGLAFSAGGVAWIGSEEGHVSDVYNSEGNTVLGPVQIPSPGGPEGGNPTGVVLNPNAADFFIPAGNGGADAAGRFLFVGVDGIVSAWNPTWGTHAFTKFNFAGRAVFTGLALATYNGSNFLYAADFKGGRIVVWDREWNPVAMPFKDWRIPRGYAPFNIQPVGDVLYVTYAKVGADGESEAGKGKGFVDIFSTDGKLIKRFAERDKLNAPWGIAMVPASFFPQRMEKDEDDHHCDHMEAQASVLVGNFGDGRINVYSLKGKLLGQLKAGKHVLEIDGLWAISLPPSTSAIDQNRLYFNAGPEDETDGLFGYLIKDNISVGISGELHD